jgi:hypothetical protein
MQRGFSWLTAVLAICVMSAGLWAQTSPSSSTAPAKKKKAGDIATSDQVEQLRILVQAQQQQLAQQNRQVEELRSQMQKLLDATQQASATAQKAQSSVDQTQSSVAQAQSIASAAQQEVAAVKSDVVELKATAASAAQEAQQSFNKAMESSVTLHFKGINITPGGYVAAETVYRSRELGADVQTPFNSLTMPGASQSNLAEFFGSGRQSKATVFFDGRLKNVDLSSYVSGDFLSAGVTSTSNQTNSYTFRLRQAWGQAKFDNGWKFLGGQMWSLVTEDTAGIAPVDDTGKANDARPKTIDSGYNVGFTLARQYGIRVTKDFGTKFSAAVAVENAQGTLTSHNNADNFLLGEAGASNSYNSLSNYTANPSPDIIAKVAFDPGFGHYEVFGLVDRFTDRIYPCEENFASAACGSLTAPSVFGAHNASKEGGGFGANARWAFDNKHIVFGLHGFGGSGVGRYGAAQLSDLAINADGTIRLIKDLQGLATLEWHGKKLDLYAYAGSEYAARSYNFDAVGYNGKPQYVGYGAPSFKNYGCYSELLPTGSGSTGGVGAGTGGGFLPTTLANCTGDTRAILEGTLGFWYSFYNGPKGRFRFGTQYSYLTRQTWSGEDLAGNKGALAPVGIDNMIFTSFRYYLP